MNKLIITFTLFFFSSVLKSGNLVVPESVISSGAIKQFPTLYGKK